MSERLIICMVFFTGKDSCLQSLTVSELLSYYYNLRTLAEVVSRQSRGRCRVSARGKCCGGGSGGWGWWVGGGKRREGGGQFHSSDYTCPTSHGARSLHHSVGEQGGGRSRKDFFVQLRDCPTSSLKCGGAKSLPLGGIIPPSPRQSFISILAKLCRRPLISAQTPSTQFNIILIKHPPCLLSCWTN